MNVGGLSMIFPCKGAVCGWDIWSSNLEKSYIFQGACHKSGRVWAYRKDGWAEKLFFLLGLVLFFFLISPVWTLTHTVSLCCLRFCH